MPLNIVVTPCTIEGKLDQSSIGGDSEWFALKNIEKSTMNPTVAHSILSIGYYENNSAHEFGSLST